MSCLPQGKELLLCLQSFIYQKENRTNGGTDSN